MKLLLQLTSDITIDTTDLNPDRVKEAIVELDFFVDENGDEHKTPETLEAAEWHDIVRHMLEEDINSVLDLESEVTSNDFTIKAPEEEDA